jgi:hypothetical protein
MDAETHVAIAEHRYKSPRRLESVQYRAMRDHLDTLVTTLSQVFPDYLFEPGRLGARMAGEAQIGPMWGSVFIRDRARGVTWGRLLYLDTGTGPRYSHCKSFAPWLTPGPVETVEAWVSPGMPRYPRVPRHSRGRGKKKP